MKTALNEFETIGTEYAQKLKKSMNIHSVDDFRRFSLEEIQKTTGIDEIRLNQWRDIIDLYRIPNLSSREAELLYFANINSVNELSHRQSLRIFYKLKEIDEKTHHIILEMPSFNKIDNWIYYAKLMTKRVKFGQNIPIILLPMVELDNASELKNFKILTVEDFSRRHKLISNLRKRINMSRDNYRNLITMIEFLKIEGIDIYIATLIINCGIHSIHDFKKMKNEEILEKIKTAQQMETDIIEIFTLEMIQALKNEIKEDK